MSDIIETHIRELSGALAAAASADGSSRTARLRDAEFLARMIAVELRARIARETAPTRNEDGAPPSGRP